LFLVNMRYFLNESFINTKETAPMYINVCVPHRSVYIYERSCDEMGTATSGQRAETSLP
jgi:hypothetical protein